MGPTRIYLIRHAETTWNAEGRLQGSLDAPLSDRGQRQVDHLVAVMQEVPLAAIYSSPLQRALETARPLGVARRLPVGVVEAFREMGQGEWEGFPWPTTSRWIAGFSSCFRLTLSLAIDKRPVPSEVDFKIRIGI